MKSGAELLVECLEAQNVTHIFTVPGAATDPILDILVDHGPEIVLCRHEQNAVFMAQCVGRLTGKAGVVMATAGPGLTNLCTGLATADAERGPVVAITGQVAQSERFKRTHQNVEAANLFAPICKWSAEVYSTDTIPDMMANAFKIAEEPREGPVHLSFPVNILKEKTEATPIAPHPKEPYSRAPHEVLVKAAKLIDGAKKPVIFLGIAASKPAVANAVRKLLKLLKVPTVGTFEAAGTLSRELEDLFAGRLGVFRNEPGDDVLANADCIITIGYDLVEYDPSIWNQGLNRPIIHIDEVPSTVSQYYQPAVEAIGDIGRNLSVLQGELSDITRPLGKEVAKAREELAQRREAGKEINTVPCHPLRVVYELRQALNDQATLITDVGSHQYWLARNFFCYEPLHFLTSMGFQTMGVSLPWAIATALVRPGTPIVSVSGDGSFLMCSMELETAVRLKLPIVHMVWEDQAYNLVKIQQDQKYGRDSAVHLGQIDTVKYAEAMGAIAYRINDPTEIRPILEKALQASGPVVISCPIDYSDNPSLVAKKHDLTTI